MKTSHHLARIRLDVADPKGQRWTDAHIIDVMNDVAQQLFSVTENQNEWAKPVVVNATGGDLIDVSKTCNVITKIDGVVDGNGALIKALKMAGLNDTMGAYGRKRKCVENFSDPTFGVPDSAEIVPDTRGYLRVSPPIPYGKTVKIRLWCASLPCVITKSGELTIPGALLDDFNKLVRADLLSMEDDSPSSLSSSDRLTAKALQLIRSRGSVQRQAKEA